VIVITNQFTVAVVLDIREYFLRSFCQLALFNGRDLFVATLLSQQSKEYFTLLVYMAVCCNAIDLHHKHTFFPHSAEARLANLFML